MPNPLRNVLEKVELFAYSHDVINGEYQITRTNYLVELSFKPDNKPEFIDLSTSEMVKERFTCWVLTPIERSVFESFYGFGDLSQMTYRIISRNQSTLKIINKVFGLRCLCEKII
jgi:hypothetical protein